MPENNNFPEPEISLNDAINRVSAILKRRRWWILSAACFIPMVVAAVAMKLPNKYVSRATLLVMQPQVSQRFVQQDSPTKVSVTVESMKLQVLSSSRLLAIVNDFGLYAQENEHPEPDFLVDRMKQDVDVQPLQTTPGEDDFDAFTVAFTAADPHLAQEVTGRLTSLFIAEHKKTQGQHAATTNKFLSDRVDEARQRLAAQEQRLENFKSSNFGELPEQQQTNLANVTIANEHLAGMATSLFQLQQQRTALELSLNEKLGHLQAEKNTLLKGYTPQYPAVIKKDAQIAQMQAVIARVRKGTPESVPAPDADSLDDPSIPGILTQAAANAAETERLTKEQERLKKDIEQNEARLSLAPVREKELTEILRDYESYKQTYSDLQKEMSQAHLTSKVEENEEGQQFRLVDPPTLPAKPSGPNRVRICLAGLAASILLGLVLAFLIDTRDRSFHDEKVLGQSFPLPVVLGMPLALSPAERRAHIVKRSFEWIAGFAMTLAMFAAEFYVFQHG